MRSRWAALLGRLPSAVDHDQEQSRFGASDVLDGVRDIGPIAGRIALAQIRALQDAQERLQSDRDLALLITIGLYALNIIDANADAHLKQYNVNEDLSLKFQPYMETLPINREINYGLALAIRF